MPIKQILFLFLIIAFLFAASCYAQAKKESPADNPLNHYKTGMEKLYSDDLKSAETEFLKAIELGHRISSGYTGMAFLGLLRSNNREAVRNSNKAISVSPDSADAYAIKACAIARLKKGLRWSVKAEKSIGKAYALNPESEIVLYSAGGYYFETGKYQHALDSYAACAGKNSGLAKKASGLQAFTGKVIKALPLTGPGLKIARKSKINRADMSVLLIEELKIRELFREKRPDLFNAVFNNDLTLKNRKVRIRADIPDRKVRRCIAETVSLGIPYIDLFPDGRFYPEKPVTRALFAAVAEGVIVLLEDDPSILTGYAGRSSDFPDVNAGYFAFNAIKLSIDRGIMENPPDGMFRPDGDVSGIDAVLMIKALGKLFE